MPDFYVVASPARTFSSLVAGMLHKSGVSMAVDTKMNPSDYANPHGFYEAMWVLNLNDDILAALGTEMYGPVPDVDVVKALAGSALHKRIAHNIGVADARAQNLGFDAHGIKDGRICLLAPLWAGPMLTYKARIITIDRPEDAVVASMMEAWPNRFFWREQAVEVYRTQRRRIDRLIASWPYPTHRVDGNALFDSTTSAVGRLEAFLGRSLDTSHLDPSGRHH